MQQMYILSNLIEDEYIKKSIVCAQFCFTLYPVLGLTAILKNSTKRLFQIKFDHFLCPVVTDCFPFEARSEGKAKQFISPE